MGWIVSLSNFLCWNPNPQRLRIWLSQFSSVAQSCPTLCDPMSCSTPGLPVHHQLPEFTQTHVHWVSNAIQPFHPLSSPSPPTFNLSQHQDFSNKSVLCIRWPKDWSFSIIISPSNDYSGLVSFRMDWLDLLAVQGTFKSLLQYHSSKASILRCSAFFTVQLSHPYMTTGKTIALTRRTFVGKVISLLLEITPKQDVLFIIGGWNAKVGSQEIPGVTGKFGLGVQNETKGKG